MRTFIKHQRSTDWSHRALVEAEDNHIVQDQLLVHALPSSLETATSALHTVPISPISGSHTLVAQAGSMPQGSAFMRAHAALPPAASPPSADQPAVLAPSQLPSAEPPDLTGNRPVAALAVEAACGDAQVLSPLLCQHSLLYCATCRYITADLGIPAALKNVEMTCWFMRLC